MKRTVYFGLMALALLMAGCQGKNDGRCQIDGTVVGEQYEGKRIFLVPLEGPQDAAHVDSIEVKDGKFHFEKDTVMMAKLLLDYHYRMGLEQLLVVTEPGQLEVTLDSVSSAKGTPQNDQLQQWKEAVIKFRKAYAQVNREGKADEAKELLLAHKAFTRKMAADNEGSVLGDFLGRMYPKTYKKKNPDGSIVTIDADTHEEIAE